MNSPHKHNEEAALLVAVAIILCLAAINLEDSTQPINQITGHVLSRVNITPLTNNPCNFTVEPGWNLVSFFCILNGEARGNVVDNMTQLISIFEYQETNPSDPWKSYNPNLSSVYVQDLQTLSRTKGYWLRMNNSEAVVISGGLRIPTDIYLVQGWNLAGYPTNETKDTTDSLSSIEGNYTEIRGFNATTQSYLSFIPPNTGGLRNTTPYHGYWINTTTNEVWTVD